MAAQATQDLVISRVWAEIADQDKVDDNAARRADEEETQEIRRAVLRRMEEYRVACRAPFVSFLNEVREAEGRQRRLGMMYLKRHWNIKMQCERCSSKRNDMVHCGQFERRESRH
jgi:hypothetical protein